MTAADAARKVLTLPAHVAAAAAGTTVGLLAAGARRIAHTVGRTAGHAADTTAPSGPWPSEQPPPSGTAGPRRTAEPRVAPSAQAAVLAPALGLSEAEVEELTGDDHPGASDAPRSEDE